MSVRTLPILLCALALAACSDPRLKPNPTVESVKQPLVHTTQLAYDVRFDGRNRLHDPQALDDYLASIRVAYGDRISVDDPIAPGAEARRQEVAAVVARHGLLVQATAPVSTGPVAPGTARVVVTRTRAAVPNCPDWSRPSNPESEASTSSNFGCAINGNLAEMIADPNDLLSGKAYAGADGDTASKAIGTHRGKAVTGAGALQAVGIAK
jgi:pilus assembly protein CpaD